HFFIGAVLMPVSYADPDSLYSSLLRNLGISTIISAVMMRYFYLRHQNILQQQAENNARIQALQARIRPHFLFNSLNTIANLVHAQPRQAEDAILDLAELFRSTMSQVERISLAQEIALVNKYLHIEALRLGERPQIHIDIPPALLNLELPPLVLQPLVENAIYHGIEPMPGGGVISIDARPQDGSVVIRIHNPVSKSAAKRHNRGNRIALENIRQRLHLH